MNIENEDDIKKYLYFNGQFTSYEEVEEFLEDADIDEIGDVFGTRLEEEYKEKLEEEADLYEDWTVCEPNDEEVVDEFLRFYDLNDFINPNYQSN